MGIFSGPVAGNNTQVRDRAAMDRTMQGAAQAYSNYRVSQALARQQALENMMSLYNGPNRALAGISGGQGADFSHVTNNPFAAQNGYFNVGRAGTYTMGPNGDSNGAMRTYNGLSVDTLGGQVPYGGKTGTTAAAAGASNISSAPTNIGGQVDYSKTGVNPVRPVPGNPFQYNPGGRR